MPQHRDAGFGASGLGNAAANVMADAAVVNIAALLRLGHGLALLGAQGFGHDHQREVAAELAESIDLSSDAGDLVGDFGDQNDVGAAGDASRECDMPGIAAHHLQHHDPVVAGSGRLQVVQRLSRHLDRGIVTDCHLGIA